MDRFAFGGHRIGVGSDPSTDGSSPESELICDLGSPALINRWIVARLVEHKIYSIRYVFQIHVVFASLFIKVCLFPLFKKHKNKL